MSFDIAIYEIGSENVILITIFVNDSLILYWYCVEVYLQVLLTE